MFMRYVARFEKTVSPGTSEMHFPPPAEYSPMSVKIIAADKDCATFFRPRYGPNELSVNTIRTNCTDHQIFMKVAFEDEDYPTVGHTISRSLNNVFCKAQGP